MATLYPLFWIVLGFGFFYIAVQRRLDNTRQILGIFGALSIFICLNSSRLGLVPYSHIWVPFVLGMIMHTTSILFFEKRVLELGSMPFLQRLRAVVRIWSNLRKLPLIEEDTATIAAQRSKDSFIFAALRCAGVCVLCVIHRLISDLVKNILRGLNIQLADFSPAKQSFLPPKTKRELYLRAIMSIHWIWSSYAMLTGTHNLLAAFFVGILRWDLSTEWPSIFGSIGEAYSLRRFWGVFWQRLHVALFEAFMPPFLRSQKLNPQPSASRDGTPIEKSLRAFWMFFLSAICHAAMNWFVMGRTNAVQEAQFFFCNYVLCLMETVAARIFGGNLKRADQKWVRPLGCAWVFTVFFTLVPAWQYPLIYTMAGY